MKKGLARMFARDRTRRADPAESPTGSHEAPADNASVRDAENIVRHAWLRDLLEMHRLAEEKLQVAVADGMRTYAALQRAQRGREPRSIVDAQVLFEVAAGVTRSRTSDCQRIRELIEAESALATVPVGSPAQGPVPERRRRPGAIAARLSRMAARRGQG